MHGEVHRVAEAAQDLELEVGVTTAAQAVVGDRVRDRAQVVRADLDPDQRPRVEQAAAPQRRGEGRGKRPRGERGAGGRLCRTLTAASQPGI